MRRLAALLSGCDPDLAAWLAAAIRGYRRQLELADRAVLPPGVGELERALREISSDSVRHEVALAMGQVDREQHGSGAIVHRRLGLSYDEVAALVGVSRRTLERHVRSGALPVARVGSRVVIDPLDLNEWLKAKRRARGG